MNLMCHGLTHRKHKVYPQTSQFKGAFCHKNKLTFFLIFKNGSINVTTNTQHFHTELICKTKAILRKVSSEVAAVYFFIKVLKKLFTERIYIQEHKGNGFFVYVLSQCQSFSFIKNFWMHTIYTVLYILCHTIKPTA